MALVCAWLRNDLRLHDSVVLHRASELARQQGSCVLPVYVFDPRHFARTRYGTWKTGPVRALFLLQSVLALKRRLVKVGSNLLVRTGRPEEVLPVVLPSGSIVVVQQEVTSEELEVERRVRDRLLQQQCRVEYCWGSTLYHKDDLPFAPDLHDMPDIYTQFKNLLEPLMACKANQVPAHFDGLPKRDTQFGIRPCLSDLTAGDLPLPSEQAVDLDFWPTWTDLPFAEAVAQPESHESAVLAFEGGEEAGLVRLRHYMQDAACVATFADTRNDMLNQDASSKLAPWLAHGCLSPRMVFQLLSEHEREVAASPSTYWFLFALLARDFFRFFAMKHGSAIFREEGILARTVKWLGGDKEFDLWANGSTGYPLVDASMRELKQTGWMSNRGRQNVASFLILDLQVEWRRGADWFESHLTDYDVTTNWANWVFAAGLAPRRINRFNIIRQSRVYDPDGLYLKKWLPELREVEIDFVHTPWLMSEQQRLDWKAGEYPAPCVDPATFQDPRPGAPKNSRAAPQQREPPEPLAASSQRGNGKREAAKKIGASSAAAKGSGLPDPLEPNYDRLF